MRRKKGMIQMSEIFLAFFALSVNLGVIQCESEPEEKLILPKIRFELWEESLPGPDPQTLQLETDLSHISLENPVKIHIPAYRSVPIDDDTIAMKDSYLDAYDNKVTLIIVDWSEYNGARTSDYLDAVDNATHTAHTVAYFVQRLLDAGIRPEQIHMIGFEMGAHIAGFVGKELGGVIGRITGLNPAGPSYTANDPRLFSSDAVLVVVYHTSGDLASSLDQMGRVDVYPNSGNASQPGCEDEDPVEVYCSQYFAIELFIKNIQSPKKFLARSCPLWDSYKAGECEDNHFFYLGEDIQTCQQGKYYLETFALDEDPSYKDEGGDPEECPSDKTTTTSTSTTTEKSHGRSIHGAQTKIMIRLIPVILNAVGNLYIY